MACYLSLQGRHCEAIQGSIEALEVSVERYEVYEERNEFLCVPKWIGISEDEGSK